MGGIFISYRRDDAAGEAGRLYDRLREHFGPERVFRDVDALEPGQRFPDEIEQRLSGCDVLLALIGPRWRGEGEGEGGRDRLEDPDDFVRLEIGAALRRGVTVVPVLLRNAPMPPSGSLPPDLRPLADHHAVELDTADFHDDATRLVRSLERHLPPSEGPGERPRRIRRVVAAAAGVATLGLVVLLAGPPLFGGGPELRLRSDPTPLSAGEVRAVIVERGFHSAASNPGVPGPPGTPVARVEGGVPVVLDDATGLMWEQGGSGDLVSGGRQGAAGRVRALNDAGHGGFSDWRLPTVEEALSLLRPPREDGFHLPAAFDALGAPFVWTADGLSPGEGGAPGPGRERGWVVYYLDGHAAPESLELNAYVRAVRTR